MTMRIVLWVCVLGLSFGCGRRMTGTYESEPTRTSLPALPTVPGMKADGRVQRQFDDAMRQAQQMSTVRLTFEGRKARLSNWGGMELVVPYRVKGGRVELLLAQGEVEQVLAFTINADGSLQGMAGRLVKVK